jgi:hypothetical protein
MDPRDAEPVPWSSADLKAILSHQLALPLVAEIDQLAAVVKCSPEETSVIIESCGCRTFADLLRSHSTSGRVLRLLKNYAKASLAKRGQLPRDVARVLYMAAILRGRQAGISDMTTLDDARIEREARRCLTFGWLPDDIRELLRDWVADDR